MSSIILPKIGRKLEPETYITKREATDMAFEGERAVRVLVKEIPTYKRKRKAAP